MANNPNKGLKVLLETRGDTGQEGLWEVIVKYHGSLGRIETEQRASAEPLGGGYAILTLPAGRIPELYAYGEIEYIELPKSLSLSLRDSIHSICAGGVGETGGQGRYGLKGKGVLVAIIDSGVDFTHPDFRNADGTSRILYYWDQSGKGAPPQGFYGGAEYTAEQFDQALKGRNPKNAALPADRAGHGTAVAGIAAGNGRASGGRDRGVAPEASIIAVQLGEKGRKSFARTTEIMRALKYVSDKAKELNMPVAINLSYGTNDGSHSGDSLFETFIDDISRRWKSVVVVAAGNEGEAGHHFRGRAENAKQVEAAFAVAEGLSSLWLTVWKSFADVLDVELVAPDGGTTGVLDPRVDFREIDTGGATVYAYYGEPSFYNGGQEIYMLIKGKGGNIPAGIAKLVVTGRRVTDGEFHAWLPTAEEVGKDTAFTSPDVGLTITLPATARGVISVGGYNARLGAAVGFSGRGYTFRDTYVKPDLAAPAVDILTTAVGGGYSLNTGTSMAAPFVTGAAAIMMEWGIIRGNDPFLYGQRVKAYLAGNARKPQKIAYPNPVWGYGALCLGDALSALERRDRA